jgi:hypothetical protein
MLTAGVIELEARPGLSAQGKEFESNPGPPITLRNLERIICKTVFLGSQILEKLSRLTAFS